MKKVLLIGVCGVVLATVGAGCNAVYKLFGTDAEGVHNYTVDKSFALLDKAIKAKLSDLLSGGKISAAEHDALLARWSEQAEPALRKLIEDMHAKYIAEKAQVEK